MKRVLPLLTTVFFVWPLIGLALVAKAKNQK
jgi:hypothetical protein